MLSTVCVYTSCKLKTQTCQQTDITGVCSSDDGSIDYLNVFTQSHTFSSVMPFFNDYENDEFFLRH